MRTAARRAALAAGAALTLVAGGGTAALADSSGSPATVYGCVAGGSLSSVTVNSAPACPAGATPVNWLANAGPGVSPSPAPTASTASPTATATTASPTATATGAACVQAGNDGCSYNDPADLTNSNGYNTYVQNDVFNPVGGSQTITAHSPGNWSVSANLPAGNGAVSSYPDISQLYEESNSTPDPLAGFASMTGTFSETMPHNAGTIAEAAFDIWTDYPNDIMVWTDDNRSSSLGGSTDLGQAVINGQNFEVYQFGTNGEIIFSLDGAGGKGTFAQESSGTVDVLATVNWVNAHVAGAHITGFGQVNYGWELCSTGGVPETFTVSAYTLKHTCAGGGTSCNSH